MPPTDIAQQALAIAGLNEHGTFGEFLRSVLDSRQFAQFWVMIFFGFVGVVANYLWKWLNDQIKGSLYKYLIVTNPKRTLLSFVAIGGWCFVTLSSGMIDTFTGWGAVINLALTTGFAVDIVINKANRSQWTEEERQAYIAKKAQQG